MRLLGMFVFVAGCVVVVPPCSDGVLDGNESDIDCGGSCGLCALGRRCVGDADCASGFCGADNTCGAPATLPSSAGAQTYHIDTDQTIQLVIQAGQQAGYGILASPGGSFRVVWTGEGNSTGNYNNFTGTVWTTAVIDSVTPGCGGTCPLESGDIVGAATAVTGGYRVDFDTVASTGLDGFDFTVTAESSTQPVYFDLLIDGQRYPQLVFFSSAMATSSPQTDPFGLTSQ